MNIAHGADVSVLRIAKLIQEILKTSVAIQHLPSRPGDVQRHRANVTRSRQMLGFEAVVGIEEGLRRYIDWVISQPNHPPTRLADEEIVNWHVGPLPR